MLAQLKTVALIKEAIKQAFFRLVEYLDHQILLPSCEGSSTQDLQFLGNFSYGIAFISQNKNRLMNFRRKVFVSGHFEPVIEPINADAPDAQLV